MNNPVVSQAPCAPLPPDSGAEYISPAHVRHVLRYVDACQWLKPRMEVLDAGCGTGYGSYILDRHGCHVEGWDSDASAIEEAKRNYPNLVFQKRDIDLLASFKLWEVDAIVCLEVIEHFAPVDVDVVLSNFRTALCADDDFLIVSTPYCVFSRPDLITPQHLMEYSLTDFELLIHTSGFKIEEMRLQRHEGQMGRLGYLMAKCVKR